MPLIFLVFLLLTAVTPAGAMSGEGCGAGKCADCHHLTLEEANSLLQGGVDRVLKVDFAEVPGLWRLEVEKDQKTFPLFLDFSKAFVLAGQVTRLPERTASAAPVEANRKVDLGKIPLEDALLIGKASAKTRVIVFTDPECPFCKRLHPELLEVVRRNPEIAFLIKLFPLAMHPNAYAVSKAIVCNKSLKMLEASFAGKPVPPPLCTTEVVDQTLALVKTLGINSTPTLVLPDGQVVPGFKSADDLLKLLGPRLAAAR